MSVFYYATGFLYHPLSRQVLLHRRDHLAPANPDTWSLIGGGSEPEDQDDPVATWLREVWEEIGVALSLDAVRSLRDYLNPRHGTHRYVFYVEWPTLSTDAFVLGEGIGVAWFPLAQALALPDLTPGARKDLIFFERMNGRFGE